MCDLNRQYGNWVLTMSNPSYKVVSSRFSDLKSAYREARALMREHWMFVSISYLK